MKNSVIMATYNGEKYLIEQLDSIKNQTLPPDEVIICDDCSSDNTCEIIDKYINQYNLVSWNLYKNEKNIGFFANFLRALRFCTGDVIYLSDQDDIWDENKLKTFTSKFMIDPSLMMIQSNFKFIDETGNLLKKQEHYHGIVSGDFHTLTVYEMCKYAGSGYTMSFRKNIADKIFTMQFDKKKELFKFHDIMLGLMAVSEGNCLLCRNVIDKHRIHDSNVTRKKRKSYISGRTRTMQVDILKRRFQYFSAMESCTDDQEKKKIFHEFSAFSLTRKEFIEKFKVKKLICLIEKRKMYASKVGVVVDIFYSICLERVVCLFMR